MGTQKIMKKSPRDRQYNTEYDDKWEKREKTDRRRKERKSKERRNQNMLQSTIYSDIRLFCL